jgi:hypothetical protein
MNKKSLFPTVEEIKKAHPTQIEKWYKSLSSPKPEELDSMKTIIHRHMKIRQIKRQEGLV